MKKKVLSQINALAKSIIASENLDIAQTKQTLIYLYEKLSVIEFLETSVETKFENSEKQAIDSKTYREENWFQDPEPVPQPQHEDVLAEPLMDKIKDLVAQMPNDAEQIDELINKILPKKQSVKNDLEEFAEKFQEMPVFERKQKEEDTSFPESKSTIIEKSKSLNDKLNLGLNIGLNDRLAFIKQLFNNSIDDYTRVLSQINSMSSYQEASSFIEENVKPDYNDWTDKNEFEERFMDLIEKRFN